MRGRATRIALVDNHSFLRTGITALLTEFTDLEIVASVASVEELDIHPGVPPDVVVTELNFAGGPTRPGAVRHLRQQGYRVLLVTAETDAERLRLGLEAGASGYLGKSGDGTLLRSCIKAAATGDPLRSDVVVKRLNSQPRTPAPPLSAALAETVRLVARDLDNAEVARTRGVSVSRPCWLVQAARVKSSRARWVARVRSRG